MLTSLYRLLENPRVYDLVQKLLGGEKVRRVIRKTIEVELLDMSYNTVLDVGCGTGLFADCFKGEYTGVDINQDYISAAAKRKGRFLVADATALPFEDETFDLVFTLGLLHHMDASAREGVLRELARVCKTGGQLLIMDGLVPSNRFNVLGYGLAKLDRGPYKVRKEEFQETMDRAFSPQGKIRYVSMKSFPYELIMASIQKVNDGTG